MKNIKVTDGGMRSRKMWMAYACILLIFLGYLCVGSWPALGSVFSEYIMGLLGAASIYSGSNTLTRWMHLKHGVGDDETPPTEPAPKVETKAAPTVQHTPKPPQ